MATDDQTGFASGQQVATAFTETPEQAADQAAGALSDIAASLVAGQNPLKSKTLWVNVPQCIAGLIGMAYTAYAGGNPAVLAVSVTAFLNGAVNSFLRTQTNGPLVNAGLNSIMNALWKLPPPTNQP